jgi:hypothetical protein
MSTDLPLRCTCGAVRGVAREIAPHAVNRLVCYCDDCQTYAHALGRAEAILDAHGGTDICQISPARLEITAGREHLACLRLTAKGLVRWYASCCNTPIGNMLVSPQPPFFGLVHCFVDPEGVASRDEAMGPSRGGIQGRFATGDRSTLDAYDRAPIGPVFHALGLMVRWWVRGDLRRSPLRDATGAPIVTPRVLSAEELAAAVRARDARG